MDGLLKRGKAPGKASPLQEPEIRGELEAGLKEGRWRTAPQVVAWLKADHGIERAVPTMYYWLGKLGGALKVPRPVHIKKNAEEARDFQEHLIERLKALALPAGRRVKVWVADESRYGLHSVQRRCWGLRGVRIVKPRQQQYEWGYVYGALEVLSGASEFQIMPSVSLEMTRGFLEQIAAEDPQAEHVIIWDQAGFHPRAGDEKVPNHIHLLPLPAYSPELNPTEKLWDIIKDELCNRVYQAIEFLDNAVEDSLRPFFTEPDRVRRLIGNGWLYLQANNSSAILYL